MSLDTASQPDPYQALTRQDIEDEYSRLLTDLKVEELRAAAQRWGIRLRETRKTSIVRQLAAQLSDPGFIRDRIGELDDLGVEVLTHLHLILAPDYGMTADNIVRSVVRHQERAQQQTAGADLLPIDVPIADKPPQASGAAIQERIAALNQQGLLLLFRQSGVNYYSLPTAVRSHLPSRPDLLTGHSQADSLTRREITIGQRIQALYAVWTAIAGGVPGREHSLSRQAPPPRRQIEDTWSALQGWDNDPDEMSALQGGQPGRSQHGFPRLGRYSSGTLNWALTVSPPPRRLSDDDLDFVHRRTGCPAPEIEFCYVLLETLGALSAPPGQPISIHSQAMYRFLRASLVDKVRTLWRAWAANETWSEMESVLRGPDSGRAGPGQSSGTNLRLRRSMAYPDFKPANLYAEWQAARLTVLRFVSLLDEGRWVTVDRFLQAVYNVHPNLLYSQTDSSVWRLESPKTGKQFGATFEDWQQGHGQFVLAMLQGPLHWLGLIRLGYSSATSALPAAFQLTPTGALALGKRAALPVGASPSDRAAAAQGAGRAVCSVSDDLTVTLLPGQAPVELYDLVHTVGSLIEATPDRFVYRLNASHVLSWAEAAVGQGNAPAGISEAIETLIAALSRHCAPPGAQPQVAADWQRKLRTWGRNYGQLYVYEGITLLELADDYALQELLVSTSLREHLVYQFSPHLVAIREDAVDQLVEDMERRGYTPRVK